MLKNAGPRVGKLEQCQNDESNLGFECGELGYECSAILKVPRIPRSSNMLRNERKDESF